MSQVTCKFCNLDSSHTYSPSEYEGYFLRDDIVVELGIRGHQQFNTMIDFLDFLQRRTQYLYKCKHCGALFSTASDEPTGKIRALGGADEGE